MEWGGRGGGNVQGDTTSGRSTGIESGSDTEPVDQRGVVVTEQHSHSAG